MEQLPDLRLEGTTSSLSSMQTDDSFSLLSLDSTAFDHLGSLPDNASSSSSSSSSASSVSAVNHEAAEMAFHSSALDESASSSLNGNLLNGTSDQLHLADDIRFDQLQTKCNGKYISPTAKHEESSGSRYIIASLIQ